MSGPVDVLDAIDRARDALRSEGWPMYAANLYEARAVVVDLIEALRLADAMLSGAHMDASVVERKVRAALAQVTP